MMQASAAVLYRRLVQVLAMREGDQPTKEAMAAAICAERISGAVCARVPEVGGRVRVFAEYFADVFGETLEGKAVKAKPPASKG